MELLFCIVYNYFYLKISHETGIFMQISNQLQFFYKSA